MVHLNRRSSFRLHSYLRHDLKASITVFFVALPLCLGISMASGAPLYSGLVSGMIGGLVVSLVSGSELSVSGPAAGLTAICASAITELGSLDIFFLSVMIAGLLQALLGLLRLGGFTHFIPSAVIKGMLAAIGILIIVKQLPLLIGYDKPDFWSNQLFNIIKLNNVYSHIDSLYGQASKAVLLVTGFSLAVLGIWNRTLQKRWPLVPTSFIIVCAGTLAALAMQRFLPSVTFKSSHFVAVPKGFFSSIHLPNPGKAIFMPAVWMNALVICLVASMETLLSIEAVDKLDPYNRITPQNRELLAQGTGNFLSGLIGGLPITAVIVRSSANAEAGARTKLSGFTHGIWLLLVVLLGVQVVNQIPYCVLAIVLVRTGYNLMKPTMFRSVYEQGREQFLPFIITIVAILLTDLLIGVLIGIAYSIYFLIKHTYRAGYTVKKTEVGGIATYQVELALNVSFLNKKRIMDMLDTMPPYSVVRVIGSDSVYIDNDILEIFQQFKLKAHNRHIQLELVDIREVETINVH